MLPLLRFELESNSSTWLHVAAVSS